MILLREEDVGDQDRLLREADVHRDEIAERRREEQRR